jgi:hypothetical protein
MKKQTCIALSFTKLEYRALVEATKEAIWIKHLSRARNFENRTNQSLLPQLEYNHDFPQSCVSHKNKTF